MDELLPVYVMIAVIASVFAFQILRKRFDPFAPIWLFLVGFGQVYILQAISYHDWAVGLHGADLVGAANFQALWALVWFLTVFFLFPGRIFARGVPKPPTGWSTSLVVVLSPIQVLWGLFCAMMVFRLTSGDAEMTAEGAIILSFPMLLLVSGILLVVSGRLPEKPQPAMVAVGMGLVALYMLLWMFNGKRSHSLVAVLTGVCVFYITKLKRPSLPVLMGTAAMGAMAVGVAISWRYYTQKAEGRVTFGDFFAFVASFDPALVLESLNVSHDDSSGEYVSHETEEYGGYLVMKSTVPDRAEYDYGQPYLRVFTTFIPRLIWTNKPLPGREQWVQAWIAGSEQKRNETFTGPAIGILGAAQLNGGPLGTFLVIGAVALVMRLSYEYFRLHATVPLVQAWWALTYYNAWFCTVNDDPLNWFYYNWGFSTMPTLVGLWVANTFGGVRVPASPSPTTPTTATGTTPALAGL